MLYNSCVLTLIAAKHTQGHILKQEAESVPFFKAEEHVASHYEGKFSPGIKAHKLFESICRVAFALSQYLHVRHLGVRDIGKGKPCKLKAFICVGASVCKLFVRGYARRNDKHFIRP